MSTFTILWPERRQVSADRLIGWARDDVANGLSSAFSQPDEVATVNDAIAVLQDTGSVTLANAQSRLGL